MKRVLLSLFLLIILSSSVSAKGIYHSNTLYNLDMVIYITKINSTTITMIYAGNKQITLHFKDKLEAKKFFDAVQVVIL